MRFARGFLHRYLGPCIGAAIQEEGDRLQLAMPCRHAQRIFSVRMAVDISAAVEHQRTARRVATVRSANQRDIAVVRSERAARIEQRLCDLEMAAVAGVTQRTAIN